MKRASLCTVIAAFFLAGCSDVVPTEVENLNSGSIEELQENPTASAALTATTGLLAGAREGIEQVVVAPGMVGRNGYQLDPGNPQVTQILLNGPMTPANFAAPPWQPAYGNLRQAQVVLDAVEQIGTLSDAEKSGIRGFTKTIMAYDLFRVIAITDENGAVVDLNESPSGTEVAPIASKEEVYSRIADLLDEAATDLSSAGTSFPMELSPGFSGFATPSSFQTFNRALAARIAVYRGNYTEALNLLSESFIDTSASLNMGVFHSFSTASGDLQNPVFDPTPREFFAHSSLVTDAQEQADGNPDLRLTEKVEAVEPRVQNGILGEYKFIRYSDLSDPIPIIKNEELILLRAEANLNLNNRETAIEDINVVRSGSGGLDELPTDFAGDLLGELIYNVRYSMLWEGGFYWTYLRRYDRLDQLPRLEPDHEVFPYFPFPVSECSARDFAPQGCQEVSGI